MNKLHLTISSPDGTFYDGDVVSLNVRGADDYDFSNPWRICRLRF